LDGYRKIHHDLLNLGEPCAANTVAKLMRTEGLKAQVGYKRRPGKNAAPVSMAPSLLSLQLIDCSRCRYLDEYPPHHFQFGARGILAVS
jgi:hypothetical protein